MSRNAAPRKGLGRGGGLENAVIVDNGRILNSEGLRYPDEFVRHKMLDAVGDLALAGAPIIGRYTGSRAGHDVDPTFCSASCFHSPEAWTWCDLRPRPGAGGHDCIRRRSKMRTLQDCGLKLLRGNLRHQPPSRTGAGRLFCAAKRHDPVMTRPWG